MSLSDLAALGSFVSGIAVVVTLVLLVLQMRQTNKNQQALIQQGRSARVVGTILAVTEPSLSTAMSRAFSADLSMDATQVHAANAYATALFWNAEDSFLQYRSGLLDEAGWAIDRSALRTALAAPAFRVAWKMNRQLSSGLYRDYVDSLLNEIKPQKGFDELAIWKSLMQEELAEAA